MKRIPLTNGGHAVVDDEWYDVLARYTWHRSVKGYAQRSVRPGHSIMMHQVVNMTPSGLWTDHINGDKLDNRAANLRHCTNAENARSRIRKVGASGYRGVRQMPQGKYAAVIMVDYKKQHLGVFASAVEAARAYDAAATRLHRSFATLNFPDASALMIAVDTMQQQFHAHGVPA